MGNKLIIILFFSAMLLVTGFSQELNNETNLGLNNETNLSLNNETDIDLEVEPVPTVSDPQNGNKNKGPKEKAIKAIREKQTIKLNQTLNSTDDRVKNNHGYIVRVHVHGLLESADLIEGPMGQQVRLVARKLNDTVNNMTLAEEKVQNRSRFAKFFFGYDKKAVNQMEQQMNKTREHIDELSELLFTVEDEEVEAMINEELAAMEEKLLRIQEKAASEKKSKGLFGWLKWDV